MREYALLIFFGGSNMFTLLYSILSASPFLMLRLSDAQGSFPKPLSPAEEQKYIQAYLDGDIAARNILIERNLRLVAHIINNV